MVWKEMRDQCIVERVYVLLWENSRKENFKVSKAGKIFDENGKGRFIYLFINLQTRAFGTKVATRVCDPACLMLNLYLGNHSTSTKPEKCRTFLSEIWIWVASRLQILQFLKSDILTGRRKGSNYMPTIFTDTLTSSQLSRRRPLIKWCSNLCTSSTTFTLSKSQQDLSSHTRQD